MPKVSAQYIPVHVSCCNLNNFKKINSDNTKTWYLTGLAVVSSDHNHALWRKVSPLVLLASICCGQLCIKYGMYVFIHFKHIICVETDIVFDNTKYKIWSKILDWQ